MVGQRGFVQLTVVGWVTVIIVGIVLSLSAAVSVQTWRLGSAKKELAAEKAALAAEKAAFAGFQAETARLGREANRKKTEDEAAAKRNKERADEDLKYVRDSLIAARRELRNKRSGPSGGLVPKPGPATAESDPSRICFDRSGLDQALRDFDSGAAGLVEEGAEAVDDINNARRWAAGRRPQ